MVQNTAKKKRGTEKQLRAFLSDLREQIESLLNGRFLFQEVSATGMPEET